MATTFSSRPTPISNPSRRTSFNTGSTSNNISVDNDGKIYGDETVKSRPLSSLSASEWKTIIMGKLDEYERRLRTNKNVIMFEEKYIGRRLPLSSILASILMLSLISIIYIFSGMRSLSTIVGVVYPFYMSLKVLNVNNVNDMNKQDNMLWLSYWLCYGMITTLESISDILFCWMGNMYELMKMALYIYLYHPQTKGALFLYHKILQPLVIQLINYEHVMISNVNTLRKNITINDQEHQHHQQQQPQQQSSQHIQQQTQPQSQFGNFSDYPNSSTNTSKNSSNFNMGGSNNSLPSNNLNFNSGNNIPLTSNNIPFNNTNIPVTNTNIPPINPNVISSGNNKLPTFVPFQPMAFAATTALNNPNTTPVVSAAPLNPTDQSFNNTNTNFNTGSNNIMTQPLQNNLQQ